MTFRERMARAGLSRELQTAWRNPSTTVEAERFRDHIRDTGRRRDSAVSTADAPAERTSEAGREATRGPIDGPDPDPPGDTLDSLLFPEPDPAGDTSRHIKEP